MMTITKAQRAAHSAVRKVLAYARQDSDAVSVFSDGTCDADTEEAVFVVRGHERVAYFKAMAERQGLLTAGKPVADPKTPNAKLRGAEGVPLE